MLRTFGEPVFLDGSGKVVASLRRKDLALLVYLCVSGARRHSRSALATLLWGDGREANARHSLTQALRRVRKVARSAVETQRAIIDWRGTVDCDAVTLAEAAGGREARALEALEHYTEHFLRDFDPGRGAEDFQDWARLRRSELRAAALRLADRLGGEAEERKDWAEALRLGQKAVMVEAIFEEGHRRIMRAWCARGERSLALFHYQRYADWISRSFGTPPDQKTQALVASIQSQGLPHDDAPYEDGRRESPYPWPWAPLTRPTPQAGAGRSGEEPAPSGRWTLQHPR